MKNLKEKTKYLIMTIFLIPFLMFLSVNVLSAKNLSLDFSNSLDSLKDLPFLKNYFVKSTPKIKDIKRFTSKREFKNYLQKAALKGEYPALLGSRIMMREMAFPAPTAPEGITTPERISETTVQVPGIDEPDIVKTDGKEIYFSASSRFSVWKEEAVRVVPPRPGIVPPPSIESKIQIIKAFPPTDLSRESEIDKTGDLLLSQNILVIFSGQDIYGYDVSNPKSPQKKWQAELGKRDYRVASRLYKNKIYLVAKSTINFATPCPIKPLTVAGQALTIPCSDIYHPVSPIPVDVTFTAMILDPGSGKIENKISFVGSSNPSSIVYVSEKAIYITYSYYENSLRFFSNFLKEETKDIVPAWLIEKIEKLDSYDISQQSKLSELSIIWENYLNFLDDDERLKTEQELGNRFQDYLKKHQRELEKTGILKIGLDEFLVRASGNVSGYPLNQFSLDEYQDYLRIATTVGQNRGFFPVWGRGESTNDVYILDKDLRITGSVKDLGKTERIYSVRFVQDKGYLVTFRQIDPFYVLDLSVPQNPQLKGELKIPGYSSYLQPITKDEILGVGKEENQVKISLFDVNSAENPKELDKYILAEYWSDILSTHHAFLLDKKHEIFFLPGSKGGYVFSYKGNNLELVKAVSDISAKRAIYLDDYLYIIGDDKIIVFNEINWEKVKELEL